jgi:apolipoprotein N-acyltransferase
VRRGAQFLAILTVDSWWGKMSGAFQHQRFAIFRAVENRRWVARCAVGGISCFIDPWGRVYDATDLFTRATLSRTIFARTEMTFYARHGDLLGELCFAMTLLVAAAIAGKRFLRQQREQVWRNE